MRKLSIRNWRELDQDTSGIAVIFDIFRCSTTLYCLASHGIDRLWVSDDLKSLDGNSGIKQNYKIFSELFSDKSIEVDCVQRFDNSPEHALLPENQKDDEHQLLLATTTGTPAMFAAQQFEEVWVGSLVGFSALIEALGKEKRNITLLPAAPHEWEHVEDEIVSQAVANTLDGFYNEAEFVQAQAQNAIEKIQASPRPEILFGKLKTGKKDVETCLDLDRYPFVAKIQFVKNKLRMAKVDI